MGHTVSSAVGRGRAEILGFQHFLVRAGKRMHVESAGAVANLAAKSRGVAQAGGEDGKGENAKNDPAFKIPAFGDPAFHENFLGDCYAITITFMFMSSCPSLQMTVQTI